jgi:predicted phosphodiesterase
VRYLILSDLHANLQATEAVLTDAAQVGYDAVLVLGDLVGYGADPEAVIDRIAELAPLASIRGNHDKVCAGLASPQLFNDSARVAIEWSAATLDPEHLAQLAVLAIGPVLVTPELEICHGAPYDEDAYVFNDEDAARAVDASGARLCLFGHTHVPAFFASPDDPVTEGELPDEYRLPRKGPALINVGAVGQPRDRDPRAAYGLLDLARGTIRLRRVTYDVAGAQKSILNAKLPRWLADRLGRGE